MYQLTYEELARHMSSALGTCPPRLLADPLRSFDGVVLVAPYHDPLACNLIDEIAPGTPMFADGTCMICLATDVHIQERAWHDGVGVPGWPPPPEGGGVRALFLKAGPRCVQGNARWLPRPVPELATDEPTPWCVVVMGDGLRCHIVTARHGPHNLPRAAATPRPQHKRRRASRRKSRRSRSR
jgi:hypothetical protein